MCTGIICTTIWWQHSCLSRRHGSINCWAIDTCPTCHVDPSTTQIFLLPVVIPDRAVCVCQLTNDTVEFPSIQHKTINKNYLKFAFCANIENLIISLPIILQRVYLKKHRRKNAYNFPNFLQARLHRLWRGTWPWVRRSLPRLCDKLLWVLCPV